MIGGGYENVYSNPIINDVIMPLQHLIIVGSLCVNGLILTLITRQQGKAVGTYKYLLSCFAINDIVYTILHYVSFPVPETFPNIFILRGHGPTFSKFWLSMYMGNYATGFPLLVAHFLYRLIALKKPRLLNHFFKLLPLILAVTLLCGASWFTSSFVFMEQDPESTAFMQPIFNGTIYSPVLHTPERGPLYLVCVYWTQGTFKGGRIKNFIALALLFVVMISAYTGKYEKFGYDATAEATVQTVVPLITAYFPVGICIFAPLFGFAWPPLAFIIPNICCIHPLFDGLVVMLTVSEYRRV
ncbi:hypothetical protein PRIPAC_81091 [Pristionchus pacificus]|uniref:G protein-coupled receptor n=1 Tax=Pristionchus pacificus TaxID=54126 RepID=A0A2A6C4G8_PRIPA|nr:hypothetical protein PRIPAC_81091 [Pristionchus pacificus]|eukprot:PDM72921.1 G protein-coupled receptor [Pristionchus pacificus]